MLELILGLSLTDYVFLALFALVLGNFLGFGQADGRNKVLVSMLWPVFVFVDFYCWALSKIYEV